MGSGADDLELVIDSLYEAAAEPQRWPVALEHLTDCIGGAASQFALWDKQSAAVPFQCVGRIDPALGEVYARDWAHFDPNTPATADLVPGSLYFDHERHDEAFFKQSAFYQDFLIPIGLGHMAAARLVDNSSAATIVGFHRAWRDGPFPDASLARIHAILPHLTRAGRLQVHLDRLRSERRTLASALDRLTYPILIVERTSLVRHANQAAERILRAREGLSVRGGRLTIDGADSSRLAATIAGACASDGARGGELAAARNRGDGRPYILMILPLPEAEGQTLSSSRLALVLIHDPSIQGKPPVAILRRLWGLTEAETRIAAALAQGRRLEDIADENRVTRETVRSQLKSIFAKTDTHTQAGLVRLVLSIPSATDREVPDE